MRIGGKIFEGRTYVMAIINVTPDSFWRDSRASAESALSAAMRAAEEGLAALAKQFPACAEEAERLAASLRGYEA